MIATVGDERDGEGDGAGVSDADAQHLEAVGVGRQPQLARQFAPDTSR